MTHTSSNELNYTKKDAVQQVLITTLVLNLLVAIGKIILGFVTGALAITADGFHSLTDGAGNVAGLVGNYYSNRPADDNHPYGHHRFETLAALIIGSLLLLTAWEMMQGLFERLQDTIPPQITPLTFGVLIATLIINIGVSSYQIREGQRLNSAILLADAENTRADVFITLAVIISTAIVALTNWVWVDMVAALVVVVLIGKAAWGILTDTSSVLVDTAPYEADQLNQIISTVDADVIRARSRGSRDATYIDIEVRVAPEMTTDQTNSIAYALRKQLKNELTGIEEVDVQFVPHHPHGRDAMLTARAYADARGLSTHEVQVAQNQHERILEMHVEVAPEQTLAQAHELVSALESDVISALPEINRIVTHIEPKQSEAMIATCDTRQRDADALERQSLNLLYGQHPDAGWHDTIVRPLPHGFALSIHATLHPDLSVEDAHTFAETAEIMLRAELPDLQRVTIHTEPYDH